MEERHKQDLMVAISFALTFVDAARNEINGLHPSYREKAALELMAALNGIDYKEEL